MLAPLQPASTIPGMLKEWSSGQTNGCGLDLRSDEVVAEDRPAVEHAPERRQHERAAERLGEHEAVHQPLALQHRELEVRLDAVLRVDHLGQQQLRAHRR